jgi:hypothetical protein
VGPSVSTFAERTRRHSAKVASLSSVVATTLSKEVLPVPRCAFFAECCGLGIRQSTISFFSFPSQTFCGMFLHYVDLHIPFWHNIKVFAITIRFSLFN